MFAAVVRFVERFNFAISAKYFEYIVLKLNAYWYSVGKRDGANGGPLVLPVCTGFQHHAKTTLRLEWRPGDHRLAVTTTTVNTIDRLPYRRLPVKLQ